MSSKGVFWVVVIIAAIAFAVFADHANQSRIKDWCAENRYEATKIERCSFDDGPFWLTDFESQSVYRVEVMNLRDERNRVSWFRIGFIMEQKWEDE